ncbi:MAG: hypothetical protein Q9219_004769 [cf. Caloplaca sp. 3 TL-2023]
MREDLPLYLNFTSYGRDVATSDGNILMYSLTRSSPPKNPSKPPHSFQILKTNTPPLPNSYRVLLTINAEIARNPSHGSARWNGHFIGDDAGLVMVLSSRRTTTARLTLGKLRLFVDGVSRFMRDFGGFVETEFGMLEKVGGREGEWEYRVLGEGKLGLEDDDEGDDDG